MTLPAPSSAARRRLVTAAKVLISAGLLVWLLHKAGLRGLAATLGAARPAWLVIALAAGFLSTVVQASQWQALLGAVGMSRPLGRCLRLVFVGNTFNTVLPTSIGGDVARAAMVAEGEEQRVDAAATVILQRLCNFPGMVLILLAGLLLTASSAQAARARPLAIAVGVAVSLGLAMVLSSAPGRLARWPLLQRTSPARTVAKLLAAVHRVRSDRRSLGVAAGRGTLFWSLSLVNQWAFMHAVGINISLAYAAVVVTSVNVLTLLPVSVNGYGLREGAFVGLLAVHGLATVPAALASALCLAAQGLLWASVGLICWLLTGSPKVVRTGRPTRASGIA